MEMKLKDLIEEPQNIKNITSIKTDYETFIRNDIFIEKFFGTRAKGFFIDKSAYLIFENKPEILFVITKEEFNKSDFVFRNINVEIQGKSGRKIKNFFQNLKEDIVNYKFALLILILLYIIIFCTSGTTIGLENLNSAFIEIISIFIGTLFVFATMFYEEKEMNEAIKSGKAQEVFSIDNYIFLLAMFSLIFTILSNGILNYKLVKHNVIYLKDIIKQNWYFLYWILKYGIAEILTGISIVFNYICFKSIIDYYLQKIKSKAINSNIRDIRESIIKNKHCMK